MTLMIKYYDPGSDAGKMKELKKKCVKIVSSIKTNFENIMSKSYNFFVKMFIMIIAVLFNYIMYPHAKFLCLCIHGLCFHSLVECCSHLHILFVSENFIAINNNGTQDNDM